jgi:hypothetical protein
MMITHTNENLVMIMECLGRHDMKKKRTCCICGEEITFDNDGLFLDNMTLREQRRLLRIRKDICVSCKREMLFAGIMKVI